MQGAKLGLAGNFSFGIHDFGALYCTTSTFSSRGFFPVEFPSRGEMINQRSYSVHGLDALLTYQTSQLEHNHYTILHYLVRRRRILSVSIKAPGTWLHVTGVS